MDCSQSAVHFFVQRHASMPPMPCCNESHFLVWFGHPPYSIVSQKTRHPAPETLDKNQTKGFYVFFLNNRLKKLNLALILAAVSEKSSRLQGRCKDVQGDVFLQGKKKGTAFWGLIASKLSQKAPSKRPIPIQSRIRVKYLQIHGTSQSPKKQRGQITLMQPYIYIYNYRVNFVHFF